MTIRFADPRAQYLAHQASLDDAMRRVVESGRYLSGEEVRSLEEEFAAYLDVDHAVGVASGTDALELALRACDIGAGDEVVTVSQTAVATVAAIARAGATPVLVDVDPEYYTIDPVQLRSALGPKTKAIVPVHLYGQPADMDAVCTVAREMGVKVIEDCAQAHGAKWDERRVGTLGDVGCFSFYPTKNLGALGDAGMVVSDDHAIAERVRTLREYGWNPQRESVLVGGVSRMDELQAAILRVKLPRLDDDNARRIALAAQYEEELAELPLRRPGVRAGARHVFHLYVVQEEQRDAMIKHLAEHDVHAGIHYRQAVHQQSAYRQGIRLASDMSVTERLVDRVVSLPMYPELTDEQMRIIVGAVSSFYNR